METGLPFSGFYNSTHDAEMDHALEGMVSDDRGDPHPDAADLSQNVHWQAACTAYARLYAEKFAGAFKDATGIDLSLTFKELDSPREYNFTTDRIFAEVPTDKVEAVYAKVDKDVLDAAIAKEFTSRSGFMSFYPNSLAAWLEKGAVTTWDANQVGTLIEALWDDENPDEDALEPWVLMDDARGNGILDDILWDALDETGKDLVNRIQAINRPDEPGVSCEG
jgi:hypothetical protein